MAAVNYYYECILLTLNQLDLSQNIFNDFTTWAFTYDKNR